MHLDVQNASHARTDRASFFRSPADIDSLALQASPEPKHVLEQLGPPPFRKTSFPMMGFLASVDEHVAAHVSPTPGDPRPTASSS